MPPGKCYTGLSISSHFLLSISIHSSQYRLHSRIQLIVIFFIFALQAWLQWILMVLEASLNIPSLVPSQAKLHWSCRLVLLLQKAGVFQSRALCQTPAPMWGRRCRLGVTMMGRVFGQRFGKLGFSSSAVVEHVYTTMPLFGDFRLSHFNPTPFSVIFCSFHNFL